MATIYGYKRFNYPTTEMVHLSAKPTGGVGASTTSGLTSADVGAIVDVNVSSRVGTVVADKSKVTFASGHAYYLIAEIPVMADATDFNFVGVRLENQGMVDNLMPRRPQQNWAQQYSDLKSGGIK